MKTPLDLTCEFAILDAAKTCCRGNLPPESEARWAELKSFYDLLMGQSGVRQRAAAARFSISDVRERLSARSHLRVPAEMETFFAYGGEYHAAKLLNLSCGGALLAADTVLDPGSRLTLYLIKVGRGNTPFLKADAEVVWRVEPRTTEGKPAVQMGIRFIDLAKPVQDELESFVIETVEQKLSTLDEHVLTPNFVSQEQLVL